MNFSYKVGPSFIRYDNIREKEITLRDEHDRVDIPQAPFEHIIQVWRDGSPACWNARGTAPGWRLYDEGIIIEAYDEDVLSSVWIPEDDFEEIIQEYEKITKPQPTIKSYGKVLSNGDFLWKGLPQFICPHSVMAALHATFPFVQLVVDDWAFEYCHDRIFMCYKQKNVLCLPIDKFTAALGDWQKEVQE